MLVVVCCRSLLQDLDVTSASRYSRTREALRPDPRYKAMPKAAREPAFKKYVAELQVRLLSVCLLRCKIVKAPSDQVDMVELHATCGNCLATRSVQSRGAYCLLDSLCVLTVFVAMFCCPALCRTASNDILLWENFPAGHSSVIYSCCATCAAAQVFNKANHMQ